MGEHLNEAFRLNETLSSTMTSGLSYTGYVPEAAAQSTRRTYQQIKQKQEEKKANDEERAYIVSQQEMPSDFKEYEYEMDNGREL